jgi:hypothetical protein
VVAALAVSAPLSAQWKPTADASPTWTIPSEITQSAPTYVAMNERDESKREASAVVAPVPGTGTSEDVALMIVGGAALVIGSVIDGDAGTLMMVGGGVMGLLGLYRYLS